MKLKSISLMLALLLSAGSAIYTAEVPKAYAQEAGQPEADTGSFTYRTLDDGTIEISRYSGSDTDLVIPAKIDGKSVSSISFFDKTELYSHLSTSVKNVVIPDGVTRIDSSAFEECRQLESITIPDSVTEMGIRAFNGCSSLTARSEEHTSELQSPS